MQKVRLSGSLLNAHNGLRSDRLRLLHVLYGANFDVINSTGDQQITLANIESKIIESNAFVFTSDARIEDLFKAASIFVGYQTEDRNLQGKPTVVLNSSGHWNAFFDVLRDLQRLGTIAQDYRDYLLEAHKPEDVLPLLKKGLEQGIPDAGREVLGDDPIDTFENAHPAGVTANVCVFCSATTRNEGYMQDGYRLGQALAKNQLGCVSGAGRSGIMGTVVAGAVDAGGWAAGSNTPHIIRLEGLPDGLSAFWLRPDIYTRMEVMIEKSQAFVILPGGAGTVQELLALMIFKAQGHPLMDGKPVVIFNRPEPDGTGFWDKLLPLLTAAGVADQCMVVNKLDAILENVLTR